MAIDDLIANGVRPAQLNDPMQTIGTLLNLRNAQTLAKQRDIQTQRDQIDLQNQQQSQQDAADVRSSYAAGTQADPTTGKPTLNRDVMLSTLGKINPSAAAKVQQSLTQQDAENSKTQADLQKTTLANHQAANSLAGSVLNGVTDQPSYTAGLQTLIQQGIVKPGQYPDVYDPQIVKHAQMQALTVKDNLDAQQKIQDQAETAARDAETANHNRTTEAQTAQYQGQEIGLRNKQVGIEGGKLALDQKKFAFDQGQTTDGTGNNLVDAIGTGKIAVDRLGYLVSKNPGLLSAVTQKYPDFDSSKAGAYVQVYKEFTSSKANTAGGALNAGGTALGHLQELSNMNTVASHIPGTPAYTAYMNKVDTVATELAKFYGDSTVPGIAAIKSTLTTTLPGNRQAAIRTQAQSMGDKLDAYQQTWDNAAPSKAYEAPMPGISQKAMEARAALDPNYHAAAVTSAQKSAGSGMVTVQIPGSPPGQIPAAALAKFKADHPNAKVSQ